MLLFLALLGCRCVICSCCTCYSVFLAVYENRDVVFVLTEASLVTFGCLWSSVLQDGRLLRYCTTMDGADQGKPFLICYLSLQAPKLPEQPSSLFKVSPSVTSA